jgi:IS1 family transposase
LDLFFFLLVNCSESLSQIHSKKIETQKLFSIKKTFSLVDPISSFHLTEFLKPLWEKNKNTSFAIRRYAHGVTPVGGAYSGGVYDPINRQVIFIPSNQAKQSHWRIYDFVNKTIIQYERPLENIASLHAYEGGVYDPLNQQIVFVPRGQSVETHWHVYDCKENRVMAYEHQQLNLNPHAYIGGVYDPLNQQIVFVPHTQVNQNTWHAYDCEKKMIISYPQSSNPPIGTHMGGVYDPVNNQIVFIPYSQAQESHWYIYDCQTKMVLDYEHHQSISSAVAYTGGVYDGFNNEIIFIPMGECDKTYWHAYQNFGLSRLARSFLAHYLFNKF